MLRRRLAIGCVVVSLAALAWCGSQPAEHDGHHQHHDAKSGFFSTLYAHASHLFNGESGLAHGVPDFCDGTLMSGETIVDNGDTLNISTAVSYTCLGIHGTVNVLDGAEITADVILVYDDGVLNIGTSGSPITCATEPCVEIIGNDNALLSSTDDPEQFGQGLLVFGKIYVFGDSSLTDEDPRSILFRSENPAGVRWHFLASQRAFVDVRHAEFADMGRTLATELLSSAVFSGDTLTTYGDNQIGRYTMHMHHVHGPYPTIADYQGYIINNFIHDDSKWGITLHNTHYFLVEDNVITDGIGSGIVEEDGSETANEYRRNVVRRMFNSATDTIPGPCSDAVPEICTEGDTSMTPEGRGGCVNVGYDPQARCASGFWFRGAAQGAVEDNVVEDVRVGFGWWTLCLEITTTFPGSLVDDAARCAGEWRATIPAFRGADTALSGERIGSCYSVYNQGVVGQCMVKDRFRGAGVVDGNTCVRAMACIEHWWDAQVQKSAGNSVNGAILNTTTVDVRTPVNNFYSDVSFDGWTATKTTYTEPDDNDFPDVVISEFNHGCPAAGHCIGSTATYNNFQAQGYLFAYRPAGQLIHPRRRDITNSTFGTKWGIHIDYGRQPQGIDGIRAMYLTNVQFEDYDGGTATQTILTGNYNDSIHGESVEVMTVYVDNFNGTETDFYLVHLPEKDPSCTDTLATVVTAADGSDLTPVGLAPLCLEGVEAPPVPSRLRFRIAEWLDRWLASPVRAANQPRIRPAGRGATSTARAVSGRQASPTSQSPQKTSHAAPFVPMPRDGNSLNETRPPYPIAADFTTGAYSPSIRHFAQRAP